MTFWTDNKVEPKRQYKYVMSIAGAGNQGIPSFLIKKTAKPSWEIGAVEHAFLNHTFYFPGKTKWQPFDVTIVDAISTDNNTTSAVMSLLDASGYRAPGAPINAATGNNLGTPSKNNAVKALGAIEIKTLDSAGQVVDVWTLHSPWVQKATFGDLDYANEDLTEVTITLQYDWAEFDDWGLLLPQGGLGQTA